MVSAQSFGDLAAAADHVGGVSALKIDQENAALDARKQHLPPEDQNLHNLLTSDSDKVAVPAEQPEEGGHKGSLRRHRRGALHAGTSTLSLKNQGVSRPRDSFERAPCCS